MLEREEDPCIGESKNECEDGSEDDEEGRVLCLIYGEDELGVRLAAA